MAAAPDPGSRVAPGKAGGRTAQHKADADDRLCNPKFRRPSILLSLIGDYWVSFGGYGGELRPVNEQASEMHRVLPLSSVLKPRTAWNPCSSNPSHEQVDAGSLLESADDHSAQYCTQPELVWALSWVGGVGPVVVLGSIR